MALSAAAGVSHTQQVRYEVETVLDLPYYDGDDANPEKHRLDMYVPQMDTTTALMMWIHGGAWITGGRAQEALLARRFAERGIAVAAISYRLSPGEWYNPRLKSGFQHPAHIVDCARAFAWLYHNAGKYGADSTRIVVAGFSSGGHLSALLATDPKNLAAEGLTLDAVRAAIPIAGAYDMEAYYQSHIEGSGQEFADNHVITVFGEGEGRLREASPTTYLENSTVPMLVVSETDTYLYAEPFEALVKKLGRTNIEFYHVEDRNHASLLNRMKSEADDDPRARIIDYIERVTSVQ